MARYREKDETDIRWNNVRRTLTRELDTKIAAWRETALNVILSGAWEEFAASLTTGKTLTLESEYKDWVDRAMGSTIEVTIQQEVNDADVA